MRWKWCRALFVLFPLSLSAGGFALEGVGPRALSLGGAYRSLAEDWSAVYWNPAGLAMARRPSLSLSTAFVSPFSSLIPKTGLLGYDGGYPTKYRAASAPQTFYMPSFGGVLPFRLYNNWGVGFSLFVPFGLGTKWNLYDPPIGYYQPGFEPDPPFPEHDWMSEIQVFSAFAGIGGKLGRHLSMGLSFGPSWISADFQRVNLLDLADFNEEAMYAPIQFRYLPLIAKVKGNGRSFGVAGGVLISLLQDRFRLGFSLLSFQESILKGDYSFQLYLPKNDAIAATLGGDDSLMFTGEVMSSRGEVEITLPLPTIMGGSFSYRISSEWLIAFGAEKTTWSVFKYVPLDFQGGLDPMGKPLDPDSLAMDWSDTWRFGGGFEYAPSRDVTLRLGVTLDETPIPDGTLTPLLPDIGKKVGVNVGLRYRIKGRYLFEGRYEFLRADSKDFSEFQDIDADGSPDNFPGKYALSIDTFEFGITVEF